MTVKWTAEKSLTLTRILTAATLILALAALFCIPVVTEWYNAVTEADSVRAGVLPPDAVRVPLTVCLYISDVLVITALLALAKMLRHIGAQKVFVPENEQCMRVISWCCFGAAAVWLVLMLWRPLAFFVAFIAAFAGLILRVIKNLLHMATELREENDYTI